jgi:hypothetical protein
VAIPARREVPRPRPAPGPRAPGTPGSGTPARSTPARSTPAVRNTPARSAPAVRGPASPPRIGTPRDWLTAAVAAVATLAVLAVPGALLAVVAGIESPTGTAVSPLVVVPVSVALGVGGSVAVQLDLGLLGGVHSLVSGTPLLVTGVALARDVLAGPTAGVGAVLGSCWLGGLALVVGGVLARAAQDTSAGSAGWVPGGLGAVGSSASSGASAAGLVAVVAVVVFAPTALLGAFAFCLGVPLVGSGRTGRSDIGLVHLLGEGPSWWLAPLVGAIVCVLGGMVAALHASSPDDAVRRGWALGPALAAVLALLTVVTALSADPFGVELDLAPAVVLGLGWGAAGGLLGAVIAPGLPPGLRQGRLGASPSGQVVGVLVVVGLLGAALAIGFAAASNGT